MENNDKSTVNVPHEPWIDDVTICAPEELVAARSHGRLPRQLLELKIRVGIRKYPDGHEHHVRAALGEPLRELMAVGANEIGIPLLPPPPAPSLDYLRCERDGRHGQWSDPITDLEKPLWIAIVDGCSRHFGIEYRLIVQINTRWGVAPSAHASPRELLTSFGLNPAEYSLYTIDGKDPLPPDTPLNLHRKDRFEAQKDGRYGGPTATAIDQKIEEEFRHLRAAGFDARLHSEQNQLYVEVGRLPIPSPPWSEATGRILIAIPATYPVSGLDAFYLHESLCHVNGTVPYSQNPVRLCGQGWRLISWHYTLNRPWSPALDDLSTHLSHCRGFFLTRGVSQ